MSQYPFTAADLEALRQWDTPTICNALEIVAPQRRGYGFTVRPMTAVDPKLPPICGLARTGTQRAAFPSGRSKEGGPLQLLRRESMSKGEEVQFNDDGSISLELHIGVDQGVNIVAVSRSIMNEVSYKLEKATGVTVRKVDVYVDTILGDK